MASPGPGFTRGNEADLGHEMTDGRLIETKAGHQRTIDRIFAAMLADMMGVGCKAIGQVDA